MCVVKSEKDSSIKENEVCVNGNYSFEEALEMAGTGRYNYLMLVFSIYSLVSAAAELFSMGITLNACKCDLDLDIYRTGLIGSVPMIGVVVSAHLWGYVADTRGRKFTLTITMCGTFLFSSISSLSVHWIMMAVTKLISAAFASGTNAVVYALLGEKVPQSVRSKFLMYTATGVMLAQAINALIAYPVLSLQFSWYLPFVGFYYRPWRLLVFLYGALSLINFMFLHSFTMESPKYYLAKGNNEDGLEILKKIFVINSGEPGENYKVKSVYLNEKVVVAEKKTNVLVSMWKQTAPLFHKENLKNTLILSYMSIVVLSVGPAFLVWLPVIFDAYSNDLSTDQKFCQLVGRPAATVEGGLEIFCDDTVSDFTLLALGSLAVFMTIFTTVSVLIVRITGKKWMFIAIHVIAAFMSWFINYVYNIGGLFMFLGIITSVAGFGIVTTFAVELFPTYLRAMGVCLTMMIGRAFSFVTINLIGPQIENNCSNFMIMLGTFVFSGAVAAFFLPSRKEEDSQKNDKKGLSEA